MKESIWKTKISKHSTDFFTYISVNCSEDYNPQEIKNDLEEFQEYLWEKYKKKSEPIKWWKKWIK